MKPLILTAASTGNKWTRKDTPYIPISVEEIISDGVEAFKAGASMLHIHARNADGTPTFDPRMFIPLIEAYKEKCPDVIIQMSVGGMEGQTHILLEPLLKLRPDIASFNLKGAREEILYMAELFEKYNVKPIIECFTPDMLVKTHELLKEGILKSPVFIEMLFELQDDGRTFDSLAEELVSFAKNLPDGAIWSQTRGGSNHRKLQALTAALGGSIRTGLEDSIYIDQGVYAKNSAELIRKAVEVAELMGRKIATPAESRKLLGI